MRGEIRRQQFAGELWTPIQAGRGIRQIQLQCGFRLSDRVTIANPDLRPGSCRGYSTSLHHAIAVFKQTEALIYAQHEADVVWFLMCFCAKIDFC